MISRVFPRVTNATPNDTLCFFDNPCLFSLEQKDEIKEAHVSVAFTYDLEKAKRLADAWSKYFETRIGGPATGEKGEDFVAGRYLRKGYVITSRGCPNKCWFCNVWNVKTTCPN